MERTTVVNSVKDFFKKNNRRSRLEINNFLENLYKKGISKDSNTSNVFLRMRNALNIQEIGTDESIDTSACHGRAKIEYKKIYSMIPREGGIEKNEEEKRESPSLGWKSSTLEKVEKIIQYQNETGLKIVPFKKVKEIIGDEGALITSQVIETWLTLLGKEYPELKDYKILSLEDKRERGVGFLNPRNLLKIINRIKGGYKELPPVEETVGDIETTPKESVEKKSVSVFFEMDEDDTKTFIEKWGLEYTILMVLNEGTIVEVKGSLEQIKNLQNSLRGKEMLLTSEKI